MHTDLPPEPTKQDFAKALKCMIVELKKVDWFLSLRHEFEIFARKLPPDFLEEQNIQDISDFSLLVEAYGLKPIVPMEEAVTTLQILMLLLLHDNEIIGSRFDNSFEFVLDATIEKLFE